MKPTGFSFLAPFHCFFFHGYEEELGGNGAIHSYSMEDVELLVETFYEYGEKKKTKLAAEEEKRLAAKEDQ